MNILAVDTALGACSVAVLAKDVVIAHDFVRMERGHAEAVAPMVAGAVERAGLKFPSFDRLGVTTGPGSFTGQRVGLAFMRGLRVALGRPLIGMTTLSAMALQAMDETGLPAGVSVHEARGDTVYFELRNRGVLASEPFLLSLPDAIARIRNVARETPVALAGSAQSRVLDLLQSERSRASKTSVVVPDALWVARHCAVAPEPDEVPRPIYLNALSLKLPGRVK